MGKTYKDNKYRKHADRTRRNKPKTIDDVCGSPPGTFKEFVKEQQEAERYDPYWNHH